MSVISAFTQSALGDLKRLAFGPGVEPGSRKATVIAISARKGGVGKTTTTVNLGVALAQNHGKRVLLVDMDAQGHVATSLSRDRLDRPGDTLSTVLLEKRRDLQEIVAPTAIDGLWTVASDTNLHETETLLSARIGKELCLRQALKLARTHFDIILIDCPPNLGTLTVSALVAADKVLIPCDLSTLGLDGVDALFDTVETIQDSLNPTLSVLGLVRTRVDRRNLTMNAAIESTLSTRYAGHLMGSIIGISSSVPKAQLEGRSVLTSDPKSRGAEDHAALATEVLGRLR
ncbi:MAG: ParA family protein [Myxococcales bacterium]|nr:ParA family protein [Myxococcales bacterium]